MTDSTPATAAQRTCRSWTTRYQRRVVCNLPKGHAGSHRGYAPDAAVRWMTTPNPDDAPSLGASRQPSYGHFGGGCYA